MNSEEAPLLGSIQVGASSAQLQVANDLEVTFNESLIAEREAEIQEIEKGVHLVNDIFVKIGGLVKDQGQLFGIFIFSFHLSRVIGVLFFNLVMANVIVL
jgi:syntaxin 7